MQNPSATTPEVEPCAQCQKPEFLCLCSELKAFENKTPVLILQHPREPDKLLGSARLAHLCLKNSTLKTGLSWPNLGKALGKQVNASNWGVLYLGPRKGSRQSRGSADRLKVALRNGEELLIDETLIEGIVILDGTWAQAKALWWRNPWLLKLKRIVLNPQNRSLYGRLRREPRRECLSTLEAIAETLEGLHEDPQTIQALRTHFSTLLKRYQAAETEKKNA
ncbi:MAG: tRNA-uridine aminocarboxypropyltransferase [Bdellovibrionota bacterium]